MLTPIPATFPAYFERYTNLVEANSVNEAIEKYSSYITDFFKNIPSDKLDFRYAEGKWSIKEMLQHLIDAERIFGYRALRIARQDKTPLPGFDENFFVSTSNASAREWNDLLEEFEALRKSTDLLFKSFTLAALQESGTTNGQPNTCVAISFVTFGHILHHINILKERYL